MWRRTWLVKSSVECCAAPGCVPPRSTSFTAERAAHARAVAETKNRRIGRPTAHPADKVEYARLLKAEGHSLGQIATKTGIPKTSLHRYLTGSEPAPVPVTAEQA